MFLPSGPAIRSTITHRGTIKHRQGKLLARPDRLLLAGLDLEARTHVGYICPLQLGDEVVDGGQVVQQDAGPFSVQAARATSSR
jgi:hypothetical protein